MATKDIQDFSAITGANVDSANDFLYLWDVSASPKDKNITIDELLKNVLIPPGAKIAIIEEQQTLAGTDSHGGAAFTQGAPRTRVLNTVDYVRNSGGSPIVTLSSNQFTFAIAGDFEIAWSCPAIRVNKHQSHLQDITGGAVAKRGTVEDCERATGGEGEVIKPMTRSFGSTVVTVSASDTFELQHECQTTHTPGFGEGAGFDTEIYSRVEIWAAGWLPA